MRDSYNDYAEVLPWAKTILDGHRFDADMDAPCTVLEMLIALAIRCESDIMHDDACGDRTRLWFWEMIKNLGLIDYTDDAYMYDKSGSFDSEVNHIIDIFLERRYDKHGRGGAFPLRKYRTNYYSDQRKVEIWYQLSAWLIENY